MNQGELEVMLRRQMCVRGDAARMRHDRVEAEKSVNYDLRLLRLAEGGASIEEISSIPGLFQIDGLFLVHPRSLADVYKKYSFLKEMASEKVREVQEAHWPMVIDVANFGQYRFPILCLPLTPEYFLPDVENRQKTKHFQQILKEKQNQALSIIKALEKEKRMPIILGALTGRMMRFFEKAGVQSPMVTGIYLTPVLISGMLAKIAYLADEITGDWKVCLVGGAGQMGRAVLTWLIEEGYGKQLTVIEASEREVSYLQNTYPNLARSSVTTSIEKVSRQDIVIITTASPRIILTQEMLSPGTIVIDDTHPANVAQDISPKQNVVLRVMAQVPSLKYKFDIDQLSSDEAVSCLAEGCLIVEAVDDFLAASRDICSAIRFINERAQAMEVSFAPFRDYRGYIKDDQIKKIRSLKRK